MGRSAALRLDRIDRAIPDTAPAELEILRPARFPSGYRSDSMHWCLVVESCSARQFAAVDGTAPARLELRDAEFLPGPPLTVSKSEIQPMAGRIAPISTIHFTNSP
jgi:hypothetical protein